MFSSRTHLSLVTNISHESLPIPAQPPNTPNQPPCELPSYMQATGVTVEQHINILNTQEYGCLAPYIGMREEQNDQVYYDPTEPHPIFPFVRNRTRNISSHHSPHFSDQLPIGFSAAEWERVWKADIFNLDAYLVHAYVAQGEVSVPWTNEHEYHGAHYRLTIDHDTTFFQLPKFTHGSTILFWNCNGRNFCYVVDHCLHQDRLNAYLKVICFDSSQRWYNICSYRPPLILVIPKNHCNVRFHPNLIPTRKSSSQRIYTSTEQEIIDNVLRGYHGSRSRSFWEYIWCR